MKRICSLLLLLSVLAIFGVKADIDIEVETEEEADDDDYQGANTGSQQQQQQQQRSASAKVWDVERLTEAGIVHVTNKLYDDEFAASDKPSLLFFTKGLNSENPYDNFAQINEILFELILDFSKTGAGHKVKIGYIDIHKEGELLKETFDIDTIPSIRLIKEGKVYHLKWQQGLWSVDDVKEFVKGGWESAPWDWQRTRVNEGLLLSFEYIINTIAEKHFTDAMANYMWARKQVHELTGYKHDLKAENPNFGKKNAFKKSQMRTLIVQVAIPAIMFSCMLLATVLFTLITVCQFWCCAESKKVGADRESGAEKKKQ